MGEMRLKVNKARFGREDKLVPLIGRREPARREWVAGSSKVQARNSYMHVLVKKADNGEEKQGQRPGLEVQPSSSRLEELEICFVGILTFYREAKLVQNNLVLEGLLQIRVTSMGDKLVLLKLEVLRLIEKARKEREGGGSPPLRRLRDGHHRG